MRVKFIGSYEDMPDLTVGKVYNSEHKDDYPDESRMVAIADDVGDRTALYRDEYEVVEE